MISRERKEQIVADFGRTPGDTGSPEVQIAILTARINDLTEHFKSNPKGATTPSMSGSKAPLQRKPYASSRQSTSGWTL